MSKWKVVAFIVLLVITNAYSLLVGKYEYFPYRQISALKQKVIAVMETDYFFALEKESPKMQEVKRLAEARESHKGSQYRIVGDVVERIRGIVHESASRSADFDVPLPAPSGYVLERSVVEGAPLRVFVHAPQGASAEIVRLGQGKISVMKLALIAPFSQSARYSPTIGLGWKANLTVPTTGLKSGYYLLELREKPSASVYQIPFIVRPRKAPRVAFVAATNTWQAFNDFGGKNFYFDRQSSKGLVARNEALNGILSSLGLPPLPIHLPHARLLQLDRPISESRPDVPHHSHLLRAEWNLAAFADANGVGYGVYTDDDLTEGSNIMDASIIVFGAHTEYWTQQMMDTLAAYIAKGGRVVFAGGNSMFFRVERSESGITRVDHVESAITSSLTGTYTADVSNPQFAPYKTTDAAHWVFAGTNVSNGDLFGKASLNHREGTAAQGVSGWEADQMTADSKGFKLLAAGTNLRGPAHMVFRDTEAGGWIFNASSIPFSGALFIDPVVARIMLNLLGGGPQHSVVRQAP
jgi:hypothetical protein